MKLRNKFIPLMSVIASTTLVAPIATSCNKVEDIAMTNVVDTYIPKYEKVKKSSDKTLKDIENLYFSHLMQNPGILKDDILKYEADRLPQRISDMEKENGTQQYVCKNVIANIGVSDPVINKHTAVFEGTEESFYTVSVTIKYQFKYKLVSLDGTYSIEKENNFTNTMNNIPTFVMVANDKLWIHNYLYDVSKQKESEYLQFVKGWNLNFAWSQNTTESWINSLGEVETSTSDTAQSGTIDRASQLEELVQTSTSSNEFVNFYLKFPSYHLSDLTVFDESYGFGFYGFNDEAYLHVSRSWHTIPSIQMFKLPSDMYLDYTDTEKFYFHLIVDPVGSSVHKINDETYVEFYIDFGEKVSSDLTYGTDYEIDQLTRAITFKNIEIKYVNPYGIEPGDMNFHIREGAEFEIEYKTIVGTLKTSKFIALKDYVINS